VCVRARAVRVRAFFFFPPKKTKTSTTSLQKLKSLFAFVNEAFKMLAMTEFVMISVLFVLFFPSFSEQ
jgi:hypothetical protein